MPKLADVDLSYLFTMLKGEPGTRKSTVALSYPMPQYWASFDRKMQALALPAKNWGLDTSQIDYDDFTDWNTPHDKLKRMQTGKMLYKTVIVDAITSVGDAVNRSTRHSKVGTTTKDGESKGKVIAGIPVNTIEDYNAEAGAFQDLIAVLLDLHHYHKVNVVIIAHVVGQRKNDESNNLTHHSRVIITGGDKISGKIAAYCTETYHFNIDTGASVNSESKYGLYTVHTGNDYARTSLPLERKIVFDDRPFYPNYIQPAIEKWRASKTSK